MGVVFWYGHYIPSPSSLCSATSPKGRGKGLARNTDLVLSYHMKSNDTRTGRNLALPLGELSPQVTERATWLSLWESWRRRRLRGCAGHGRRVPSPSSLRSDTSPRGRGKGVEAGEARVWCAWLSLWESWRRRRLRGCAGHERRVPSPSSLRSDTSPKGRGKWGCGRGKLGSPFGRAVTEGD